MMSDPNPPAPKRRLKRPAKSPKTHAANVRDRVARAANAPTPRSIETAIEAVPRVSVTAKDMWRGQARSDYVMDPDQRSVTWHYQRTDRPYSEMWSAHTFSSFATAERWTELRAQFWRDVELRVWNAQKEKVIAQRLRQLEQLTEIYSYGMEWMGPLVNPDTGGVQRYPADHAHAGLPMFPLDMPSFDRFASTMIKLQQQIGLMRGEATSRSESTHVVATAGGAPADPVGASASFSQEELRAIARLMIRNRQPELAEQPEIDIASDGRPDVRSEDDER